MAKKASSRPTWISDLSPRHREVFRLIGSERLSYKKAASALEHRYVEGRGLAVSTVRQYVREIYEITDGSGSPREWLIFLWGEHKDDLGGAA